MTTHTAFYLNDNVYCLEQNTAHDTPEEFLAELNADPKNEVLLIIEGCPDMWTALLPDEPLRKAQFNADG